MREKLLDRIAVWSYARSGWLGLVVITLTILFAWMASQIHVTMNMTDIMPEEDPMVEEFNTIFEEFNGAANAYVVVEGDLEKMIEYAETLAPQITRLEDWVDEHGSADVKSEFVTLREKIASGTVEAPDRLFERVDFKVPLEFMRDHGFMLIKPDDLKNTRQMYTDPNLVPFLTNLNNSLEAEYVQSEQKISSTQREQNAIRFLDGVESWVDLIDEMYAGGVTSRQAAAAASAITLGNPYMVSPDRSMLLMVAVPGFDIMDMDLLVPAVNGLEELVKSVAADIGVQAGLAGTVVLQRDEMNAVNEDSMVLTLLALVAVFILFVITFRMWVAPILAMVNLIIGVIWAMGISWLIVGTLNMFTVMMSVVLVGLGVDFSIHIISVFTELRLAGQDARESIRKTMRKVGSGVITGGLTTSFAFLTLLIGRSKGISEFGLVSGIGLITIMISTLLTMPLLLMLRERFSRQRKDPIDVSYNRLGGLSVRLSGRAPLTLVFILLITVGAIWLTGRVTMDYNYLDMEPKGLESILLNDRVIDRFNMTSETTLMTARTLEENLRLTEAAREKSSINYVESISDFLPSPKEQQVRKKQAHWIQEQMSAATLLRSVPEEDRLQLLDELIRLEDVIIEMQDLAFVGGQDMLDDKASRLVGNPDHPERVGNLTALIAKLEEGGVPADWLNQLQQGFSREYRSIVLDMSNDAEINLADLPAMVRDKYVNRSGDRFLLTLYPKGNVWNIDYLGRYTEDVLDVSPSVAGTAPMFYFMLKIIGEDGRNASLLTLLVVFILLWIDLKKLRYVFLAMIPLIVGLIWTLGIMGATGVQITLLNMMAIPLILGIGIDDGVHVMHRYLEEGGRDIRTVFSSTGKAVIITSLTTMLSFGSLVFATYRGFGSLGLALFIGVGSCLLATLLVMPGLLGLMQRKQR